MSKAIMIQGTMSNAGKSLITAGLCRIFMQDGYRAVPFKSQNMALNSYITHEGLEMGRAQAMQAEAAGIEPSVLMNPILLKPTNETGSQVIVNGEVIGNMGANEYFSYKHSLVPVILEAYSKLLEENDIVVIEGAGSPAEINLNADDIVNMGMARMANAPVLLVGDIDKGGVFASLYGTVELVSSEERKFIKGTIINKFRGDKKILDPGLEMLEHLTNLPVLGVVPYMQLDLEDEDSLSERLNSKNSVGLIDIAVIRLPHISNFTDFNPLEQIEGVTLRYVQSVSELKNPDLIILPGTKNTMADLLWIRQNGLEAAVLKHHSSGGTIFGICGGYQMLSESLSDPQGLELGEGKSENLKGLGLLPTSTVFEPQKVRTRVQGVFHSVSGSLKYLSGTQFEGYEIHMGRTSISENDAVLTKLTDCITSEEKADGAHIGNVYGSYVHGLFESQSVTQAIVKSLCEVKGLDMAETKTVDFKAHKEQQFNKLADTLRQCLDMNAISKILESGV